MHDEGTDSKIKVFANIFISFIGAGILGLPYAFREVSQFWTCETTFTVCAEIVLGWSH